MATHHICAKCFENDNSCTCEHDDKRTDRVEDPAREGTGQGEAGTDKEKRVEND